ncbi:protein MIZU-KUSSEI 1-like [Cornus florida]|uniref:protein MIZU-KUSSEI 1-like n=1 Tax=Cornus florida TaxID=4283 RepID=UPI00289D9236|nr:protein MIZU-KUSSEI 1-like [Cornus florida]
MCNNSTSLSIDHMYPCTVGATSMAGSVATVDCQKQVRSWRLLRSLAELLIPSCNCTKIEQHEIKEENYILPTTYYYSPQPSRISSTLITGTIFGFRHGKVSLCIQTNNNFTNPLLLLELAVPTNILAREMRGGILRIALDCTAIENDVNSYSLLSMPVWTMYCNGRKVGFAVKRRPSKADMEVLKHLESVVVGAGIISGEELINCEENMMYLRGNFERVHGSSESESFHLIDPDGSISQQLSIFFIRSRC